MLHIVAFFSYCCVAFHWMNIYIDLFTNCLGDGYLHIFPIRTIMNKAGINIPVRIF